MDIKLCDLNGTLCSEWRSAFRGVPDVEIIHGSIFTADADAIVSPANSFGFMDGGIDALYLKVFGYGLQDRLQQMIRSIGGELLVGQALAVPTNSQGRIQWVISAPTMRTPQIIRDAQDVRLSTRAALREAQRLNLSSVALTGMGAGSGRVPADICATFMRLGWRDVFQPLPFPSSWREAATDHVLEIAP